MKSAPMITLFSRPQLSPRRDSASFTVSIVAHAAGFVCLFLGLSHSPRIESRSTLQHFTVRVLDTPLPNPQPPAPSASAATAHTSAHTAVPVAAPDSEDAPAEPAPAPQLAQLVHQSQVLVQPDAPPDVLLLHNTPVPTVFLWNPSTAPIKPVIQAPLQKSMVAQLRPRIDPPNREVNLADVRMSSTPFSTTLHSLPPSNTSPIIVRGPDPVQQMPQTATQPTPAPPTPVRVMSISDLQAEGPIAIPLANASTRPSPAPPTTTPGRSDDPAASGHSATAEISHPNPSSKPTGNGSGHTSGVPAQNPPAAVPHTASPSQNSGASIAKAPAVATSVARTLPAASAAPAPAPGSGTGSGLNNLGPVTHITLPKDGQFGVVVVGSSLADQYPETVGIWNGRLVYTVYLHVGGGKSWILQYSIASSGQSTADAARPDAPWPYDIVRPHFDPDDFNSDALMVHGFITAAGRFEHLALVFPEDFAKAKFLLSALQQWEFRPARQNGQVARVEILLIIPEETE